MYDILFDLIQFTHNLPLTHYVMAIKVFGAKATWQAPLGLRSRAQYPGRKKLV